MNKRVAFTLIFGFMTVMLNGCATRDELQEWLKHPTHFASGQHMGFSLRNPGDTPTPNVTRKDINAAQEETWWGKVILVKPEQIFEN